MQKAFNTRTRKAQKVSYDTEALSEETSTSRALIPQASEDSGAQDDTHGDSSPMNRKTKRDAENSIKSKFSKKTTDILKAWLIEHIDHPYPSDEAKDELARLTNLNRRQIQNWFTNTRKVILTECFSLIF